MKRLPATLLLLLSGATLVAQEKDTLRIPGKKKMTEAASLIDSARSNLHSKLDSLSLPGDSASRAAIFKAYAVRKDFQVKVDSLQLAFQKPVNILDSAGRSLKSKLDSLQSLTAGASTKVANLKRRYSAQLDSVNNLRTEKLAELNQKVDHLKGKATESLKAVSLPPQLQEPVQKLTESIKTYKVPIAAGKIPGIDLSSSKLPGLDLSLSDTKLPSLGNTELPGLSGAGLNGITTNPKEISNVTGQAGDYGKDIQNISKGKMQEIKTIDKAAENEAMKMEGMGELKGKTGELDKYKQLSSRPDSAALKVAKEQALKELTKEATDHFAGKEVVLKEAMGKMAKLKAKYSEVKSLGRFG